MRRSAAVVATVLTTLGLAACGGSSSNATRRQRRARPTYNGKPVTITFWNPFTGRQLAVMNSVIADFHKLYPKITVNEPRRDHRRQHRRGDPRRQPPGPDDVAVG